MRNRGRQYYGRVDRAQSNQAVDQLLQAVHVGHDRFDEIADSAGYPVAFQDIGLVFNEFGCYCDFVGYRLLQKPQCQTGSGIKYSDRTLT